ncbi:hypothetical protein CYMTET_11500 [Cymbomonas tetramitiformis]|uniref:Uncharacterized protein n=1 Tax=Cymbomonas tetramitiformis TaxID=36881 RepID=A0AAE0GNK7_9CHLO|nr:hypothetical protein CYMTET_11500 [Cymbomonas tetramitiformis]
MENFLASTCPLPAAPSPPLPSPIPAIAPPVLFDPTRPNALRETTLSIGLKVDPLKNDTVRLSDERVPEHLQPVWELVKPKAKDLSSLGAPRFPRPDLLDGPLSDRPLTSTRNQPAFLSPKHSDAKTVVLTVKNKNPYGLPPIIGKTDSYQSTRAPTSSLDTSRSHVRTRSAAPHHKKRASPKPKHIEFTSRSAVPQVNKGVQASPCAWTRYYFPQSVPEQHGSGVFFQHFDVFLPDATAEPAARGRYDPAPLPYQLTEPLPHHLKDMWRQLFYVSMPDKPGQSIMASDWPQAHMYSSQDLLQGLHKGELLLPKGAHQRVSLAGFCKILTQLQPRTADDVRPLMEVRNGVLQYLGSEMEAGAERVQQSLNLKEQMARQEQEIYEMKRNIMDEVMNVINAHGADAKLSEIADSVKDAMSSQLKMVFNANKWVRNSKPNKPVAPAAPRDSRSGPSPLEAHRSHLEGPPASSNATETEAEREAASAAAQRIAALEEQVARMEQKSRRFVDRELAMETELDKLRPLATLALESEKIFEEMCEGRNELAQYKKAYQKRLHETREAQDVTLAQRQREAEAAVAEQKRVAEQALEDSELGVEQLRRRLNETREKFLEERGATVALREQLAASQEALQKANDASLAQARRVATDRAAQAKKLNEELRRRNEAEWEAFSSSNLSSDQEKAAAALREKLEKLSAELNDAEEGQVSAMEEREMVARHAQLEAARREAQLLHAELQASAAQQDLDSMSDEQQAFTECLLKQIQALEDQASAIDHCRQEQPSAVSDSSPSRPVPEDTVPEWMEHDLDFLADSQLADAAAASETSAPDVKALMKQVTDLQSIKQHLLAQIATRGEKLERLNAHNLDMARLGKLLIESDTDLRDPVSAVGALHADFLRGQEQERQKEAERGIQYKELRRKVLDLDAIASGMQECGWLGGVPPPSLAKLKEGVSQLEELALDAERVHAEELQAAGGLANGAADHLAAVSKISRKLEVLKEIYNSVTPHLSYAADDRLANSARTMLETLTQKTSQLIPLAESIAELRLENARALETASPAVLFSPSTPTDFTEDMLKAYAVHRAMSTLTQIRLLAPPKLVLKFNGTMSTMEEISTQTDEATPALASPLGAAHYDAACAVGQAGVAPAMYAAAPGAGAAPGAVPMGGAAQYGAAGAAPGAVPMAGAAQYGAAGAAPGAVPMAGAAQYGAAGAVGQAGVAPAICSCTWGWSGAGSSADGRCSSSTVRQARRREQCRWQVQLNTVRQARLGKRVWPLQCMQLHLGLERRREQCRWEVQLNTVRQARRREQCRWQVQLNTVRQARRREQCRWQVQLNMVRQVRRREQCRWQVQLMRCTWAAAPGAVPMVGAAQYGAAGAVGQEGVAPAMYAAAPGAEAAPGAVPMAGAAQYGAAGPAPGAVPMVGAAQYDAAGAAPGAVPMAGAAQYGAAGAGGQEGVAPAMYAAAPGAEAAPGAVPMVGAAQYGAAGAVGQEGVAPAMYAAAPGAGAAPGAVPMAGAAQYGAAGAVGQEGVAPAMYAAAPGAGVVPGAAFVSSSNSNSTVPRHCVDTSVQTDFPAAAMPSDSGAGASQVAASSREPAAGEVGAVRDGVVVEAAGTSGAAGGPRHSKGSEGGAAPAGAGNNFWEVLPDPVAQQELKQALDIPAFAEVGRVLHKMLTEGGKKRGSLLTAAAILSFLPEQMQTPPWREAVGAALAQMVNSQIDQRPQSKQSEQSLSEPKEMDDLGFIRTYFRSASLAPSDADLVGASQLVVGYLEQTTEVPMLLARITYDPTRDNDTTDDLTTYDDNTLTVDAMTQNFPGGYEAGAYLPQDPASLYYRAANMGTLLSEETADGVMMHVQPIMMPEGNGCMTHGNCYGVVAYVGSEDTIPENMTEIVDAICQEIRNTVIMVGTRLEGLISERTAKATLSANRGSMILDKRQRWAMQKVDAVTALLSDFRSNQLSPEEQEEYSRLMDGMKGDGPDEAQLQRKAKNMVKILNLLPEWRAVCADVTEGMQAKSQAEHIFLHHAQLNTCLSEVRKCNVMSRVSVAAFCATLIILGDEELLEEPGINGGQLTSNDNGIKGIWKRCRLLLKKTVIVNERNYKQTTNLLDSMQMFSPQGAKITPAAMKAVEQLQAVAVTALSGGRTVSVSNVIKAVTVALTEWNTAIHNILVARDLKLAIEEDVKRQYERKE